VLCNERFFKHVQAAEIEDLGPQRFVGMPGYKDQREPWTGVLPFQQVTPRASGRHACGENGLRR
jgi:hypothetical protein